LAKKESEQAFFQFVQYLVVKEKEIQSSYPLPVITFVGVKAVQLRQVLEKLIPGKFLIVYVIDDFGNNLGIVSEIKIIRAALSQDMNITLGEILPPR